MRMTASRLRARRHAVRRVVATRSSGGFVRRAPPPPPSPRRRRDTAPSSYATRGATRRGSTAPGRTRASRNLSRTPVASPRARSHLFAVVHRRVEALVEPVSRRDGVLAAPARDEISVSTKPVPRRDVPRRRPRPRTRGRLPGSPAKLRTAPVHHAAAVDRAQSPREKRHHLLVESLKREDVFASARVQKLRKRVAVIAAVRGEMRTLPVVHPAPARAREGASQEAAEEDREDVAVAFPPSRAAGRGRRRDVVVVAGLRSDTTASAFFAGRRASRTADTVSASVFLSGVSFASARAFVFFSAFSRASASFFLASAVPFAAPRDAKSFSASRMRHGTNRLFSTRFSLRFMYRARLAHECRLYCASAASRSGLGMSGWSTTWRNCDTARVYGLRLTQKEPGTNSAGGTWCTEHWTFPTVG